MRKHGDLEKLLLSILVGREYNKSLVKLLREFYKQILIKMIIIKIFASESGAGSLSVRSIRSWTVGDQQRFGGIFRFSKWYCFLCTVPLDHRPRRCGLSHPSLYLRRSVFHTTLKILCTINYQSSLFKVRTPKTHFFERLNMVRPAAPFFQLWRAYEWLA